MRLPRPIYGLYERRILASLPQARRPCHVGVILDGNRRWAKAFGEPALTGHQRGADKIAEFLSWCEELDIQLATLWMLSTDNLSRSADELQDLLAVIEGSVTDLAAAQRWRIRVMGRLDMLPAGLADALRRAETSTAGLDVPMQVNIAVGYGGRDEIADAVRAVLREREAHGATLAQVAADIDAVDIAAHLYTKGQPDPDLVIRTSGEQRLSGFLLWQSAHSEFYFCEAFWPEFRRVDFLRALRSYSVRERRLGR
ncbi:isoprenyl transferase [Rarobacter incanus]|uniref:isoprenyl transferase n=1 Tax=Rarobacter incanus TaxID=153494 RepID=UPI00114F9DEC|nr:isoprenyl transferase [Rarobacter incanus]